jgi:hypothetical protein
MNALPYWKLVLRKVLAATVSHARNKILAGLVFAILALVIQYRLNVRGWSDTEKIALSLVAAAVVVLCVSFLSGLVTVPAAMYAEPAKRTAAEEYHYQKAWAFLAGRGPEFFDILRHLKTRGNITLGGAREPSLPTGIDASHAKEILKELEQEGIVESKDLTPPLAPYDPGNPKGRLVAQIQHLHDVKIVWTVAPGFEAVLDELLYQSAENQSLPASSPQI